MRLNRDNITGLVLIALAAVIYLIAWGFVTPAAVQYGAGFFPKLVAGGLALSGGLVLLTAGRDGGVVTDSIQGGAHLWRIAALAALIVTYALTLELVGFLIVTPVLLFLASLLFGGRVRGAIILAVLGTAVLHLLFYGVMKVTLPWGLMERFAW